jgi:hypothetical protein
MNPNELYAKLVELSQIAGMNQRYYEYEEASLWRWDCYLQLIALMFGALTLTMTVARRTTKPVKATTAPEAPFAPTRYARVTAYIKQTVVPNLDRIFAFATIVGMGFGQIFTVSDWQRKATELRTYWTQIRSDTDATIFSLAEVRAEPKTPSWILDRFNELHSRRITIMSSEPTTKPALLEKCQLEEMRSRGITFEHTKTAGTTGRTRL